ncbi:MAG: GNAT family N-acetyltransferase [Albidovulum sp.]
MPDLGQTDVKIRQLAPADATIWRDIRLEALAREPEQFSALHADWVARPLADFADMIGKMRIWAALAEGRAVAVAALYCDHDRRDIVSLMAVYTRPEARGMGYAQRLIATAEAAARASGAKELRLNVRAANPAARGLYAGLGFCEIPAEAAPSCSKCEITMAKPI